MELNSYLLRPRVDLANVAANGPIGAAAATVDVANCFGVSQTTAGRTLTLPNPTNAADGREAMVYNAGTQSFVMHTVTIQAGAAALLSWQSGAWRPLSSGAEDFWRSGAASLLPDGTTDVSDLIIRQGDTSIGMVPSATGKVGAATLASRVNIEYGDGVVGTQGRAALALYNANNGAGVSTRAQFWNTDAIAGTIEQTNASYTGVGGANAFAVIAPLTSPLVFGANAVEAARITTAGNMGVGTKVPTSRLQTAGSFAAPVLIVSAAGTTTLDVTHHTVEVASAAATATISLPLASSCAGRVYIVKLAAGNTTSSVTVNVTGGGAALDTTFGTLATSQTIQHPVLRSATWQSDGTNWQLINTTAANFSQPIRVPIIRASATIVLNDPIAAGARPIVAGAFNVASATGLDAVGTDARLQVVFSTPLTDANYVVNGHLRSIVPANWNNDNETVWTVVTRLATGFTIATRELSGTVQGLEFDFQIQHDQTVAVGLPAWEVSQFVPLDTPVALDNIRLEARITGGQGFRISTVAGTSVVNISAVTSFATDSVFSSNRPNVALTTTMIHPFIWVGQTDADGMTGQIYDRSAGRFYEFTIMTNVAPVLSFVRIKRLA